MRNPVHMAHLLLIYYRKYNRQFISQAMITPGFNDKVITQTIELWEEMETYWNSIGENKELDLKKWMAKFTNEIISKSLLE